MTILWKNRFRGRPSLPLSKRTDMLHSISWTAYWIIIGVLLLIYYGWLLLKYWGSFRWGGKQETFTEAVFTGEGISEADLAGPVTEPVAVPAVEGQQEAKAERTVVEAPVREEQQPTPQQAKEELASPAETAVLPDESTSKEPMPPAQEEGQPAEKRALPRELAERLVEEVKGWIEKAVMEDSAKPELLYGLQKILDKEEYELLRGSQLQERITTWIVSVLEKECSIHLDAGELSGLWAR